MRNINQQYLSGSFEGSLRSNDMFHIRPYAVPYYCAQYYEKIWSVYDAV